MISVASKRKSKSNLLKRNPSAILADVTSKAQDSLVKLSPFYPHGGIPIPYSVGNTSMSVEGIWQGLKVFNSNDIDFSSFNNSMMKNIKRTVRKYGMPIGHRKGVNGNEILDYVEARILIYLPTYKWVLENKVQNIVSKLKSSNMNSDIILLDYSTNCNILDTSSPLSHAYLLKCFVENEYPKEQELLSEYRNQKYSKNNSGDSSTKKLNTTVSLEEISFSEILNVIEKRPRSSKDIINQLSLNINPRRLTSLLKKSSEVITIKSKPLRFEAKVKHQRSLFGN